MTNENIDQLIDALNRAATRFAEEGAPNYLYIDREDGEWGAEFRFAESCSPLAMEMTEWTTREDAAKDFALVRSGRASEVANEIAKGWDEEWDS
jgi:hypothetical protein